MIIGTPDDAVAKYLLQVTLTYRKGTINRIGSFHVFKKGGWFGHADQLLKWCPHGKCTGLISDNFKLTPEQVNHIGEENLDTPEKWPFQYRALYENWYQSPQLCPKCGKACGSLESLPDSYGFNLPEDRIAKKMADMFYELGGDCDLYLVRNKVSGLAHRHKAELHDASTSKGQRRVRSQKKLEEMRANREKVFYPLRSIISDTQGSDVSVKFKALLGA